MYETYPRLAVTQRVSEAEAGPVVVFLHGLGCDRRQFVRQYEGLDQRLRLVGLDLPGHGESPGLPRGAYRIQTLTTAVERELRTLACQGAVVVGHSAGGLVALQLAVTRPDLVSGIVLLDTNTALTESDHRANRIRAQRSDVGDWRGHFIESMADAWGNTGGTQRDAVFQTLLETPEDVARPLWNEILAFRPESLWRRCPVPSLYVRTRRTTDLALLRSLNPLISTLNLSPRCDGHWPHLQCPDLVNEAVQGFVARIDR
jgi:pimeloyl-ACP methyl ester carboxylesterase